VALHRKTIIILITSIKITRKMVQPAHMGIKNRGRECSEIEEKFYRRRGMSGRGFVTGTQPTDVG